jgi:hypothetical protein
MRFAYDCSTLRYTFRVRAPEECVFWRYITRSIGASQDTIAIEVRSDAALFIPRGATWCIWHVRYALSGFSHPETANQ